MTSRFGSLASAVSSKLHSRGLTGIRHLSQGKGISNEIEKVHNILSVGRDVVRNFAIIAHIDHGKSTLSDALLEVAGNLSHHEKAPSLDTLTVEKERGITVKAQGASMFYEWKGEEYCLNLVDTPGHVDFSNEVRRSLSPCQGVLCLVDASQSIQAQTLSNYELAFFQNKVIIPCITKCDMEAARPERVKEEITEIMGFSEDEILETSSKTGEGVASVFGAVIDRIPPPDGEPEASPRVLLYDSFWHEHKGVICLVYVHDGKLRKGDTLHAFYSGTECIVNECGILTPSFLPLDELQSGQIGYFVGNIRDSTAVSIGDTLFLQSNRRYGLNRKIETHPFPILESSQRKCLGTVQHNKSMVYSSLYPCSAQDFGRLQQAIERLLLTDASVKANPIHSDTLGAGFRCGFLGILHMEVFRQRIEDETDNLDIILAAPSITYHMEQKIGEELITTRIESPEEYPENPGVAHRFLEPVVRATIICESQYLGEVTYLTVEHDGMEDSMEYVGKNMDRCIIKYKFPLRRIVGDFYTQLLSVTRGTATFDYDDTPMWEPIDLVKVTIMINKKPIGPLSILVDRKTSYDSGKALCTRLSKVISRQLFDVSIQAVISGKVIAKKRLAPYRRDVLVKHGKNMGTGDISRKKKLLNAQKEGKKRMKEIGRVKVPQEAFMAVLKS